MKYNSVLDLHTHTIVSGHAYSTLREMAKAASDKGLELLGITEHAPKMPGTCHLFYFDNLRIVPRELYGIELVLGSEVNILDAKGTVDLPQKTMEKLDIIIASLHTPCMEPGSCQENTEAYLNAMKNPCVNIIGHPDDARYPVDYELLADAAAEYGVILEVNNSSLSPDGYRGDTRPNDLKMLAACRKRNLPVIMASDSHGPGHIGDFTWAEQILREVNYPAELILNSRPEKIREALRICEDRQKHLHSRRTACIECPEVFAKK